MNQYSISVTEVIQADKVVRTVSRDGITLILFKIITNIFGGFKNISYICNNNMAEWWNGRHPT